MELAVIGISHQQAPIEIREAITFTECKKIKSIITLLDYGISEVVILATCNRSEVYIYAEQVDDKIKKVKQFFQIYSGLTIIIDYLFVKKNRKAISYLFRVSAGLESLVLGEDQILGQVKKAYELARSLGASKKVLNRLFQQSVATAKEIKTKTKISHNPLSMSYIAVKFLKDKVETLKNKNILIIGTGKISKLALNYLMQEEMDTIYIASRSIKKGMELKLKYRNITPLDYDLRYTVLNNVDIVLSATSAPHLVLKKEEMPKLNGSLVVIDIAMPRDIDPNINKLDNISLYNMDFLKSIQHENIENRKRLSSSVQSFIDNEVYAFEEWLEMSSLDPTIKSLNDKCKEVCEESLSYLFNRLELSNKEMKLIDSVLESSLKRLVREPIVNLKQMKDKEKRESCAKVIEELFNIEKA